MIYIIKKKSLYQNKVNFSLVSSCNSKMGYCAFWVKAKQTNLTIYIILTLMRCKSSIIPSTDDTTHFHANEEFRVLDVEMSYIQKDVLNSEDHI